MFFALYQSIFNIFLFCNLIFIRENNPWIEKVESKNYLFMKYNENIQNKVFQEKIFKNISPQFYKNIKIDWISY